MERELKIVFSIFLVYLMYGIASFVDTRTLITPIFLTSTIFVIVALIFAIINRSYPKSYALILYVVAFIAFALVDDFVIGFIGRFFGPDIYRFLTGNLFGFFAFLIFFGFLFFTVWFLYVQTRKTPAALMLLGILSACIILFFTPFFVLQEVSIQLFCLFYFIFGQRGSEPENKVLRVIAYQFLLFSLLESFEYFL